MTEIVIISVIKPFKYVYYIRIVITFSSGVE